MLFSIITINYNNASGLERTIRSVVAQTFRDYEYIVIDGGSTDGSRNVIEKYKDKIDYWVSEPDGGIYPAMNKGTRQAHGDYCIYMNSGDEFYDANVLENAARAGFKEDIVSGNLCIGNTIMPNPDEVTLRTFYLHTIYHQATFIRTSLIKTHPYDETMKSAADWKFFLHALVFHNATYRHIPITVASFEGGGVSFNDSSTSREEVRSELERCLPERILRDYDDYCAGLTPYRRMMNMVEEIPPLRRIIFGIDRLVLKLLNLKLHAKWIKEL